MTTAQIKALRGLKENGTQPRKPTGDKLVEFGFCRKSKDGGYFLTPSGQRWIANYVEQTGDGPEDLKAILGTVFR
jgi:hypothetical protein